MKIISAKTSTIALATSIGFTLFSSRNPMSSTLCPEQNCIVKTCLVVNPQNIRGILTMLLFLKFLAALSEFLAS
uniref:Uncharacterized protein n=1 Tax=Rhizophora mucronata TaxID=61149 RepID=A0A2P2JFG3_RHIMU